MEDKLGQVFEPEQTESLVDVLDNVHQAELARAADMRDLKQGLAALTEETKKLATAQRSTDERVTELAAAQYSSDQRLNRLPDSVERLAETVHTGLADLRNAFGGLANRFGFDLEEFVAALLPPYLERHRNITHLHALGRRYFALPDGQHEEVDLVGTGRREGDPVTILAECRTTIGGGEMRRVAKKLEAVAATLTDGEVLKIVGSMNLHPTGEEAALETGIWAIPYSHINRQRGRGYYTFD